MDRLNALSYAYHYRNIDSVEYYASAAKGTAEGLNNLAFVKMVRMDYKAAEDYLNQIPEMTDNQLELLVCYVQQMRLCQRRSSWCVTSSRCVFASVVRATRTSTISANVP